MRNRRITSTSQRKRQLSRQHHKVATRRQEFFIQIITEEKTAE